MSKFSHLNRRNDKGFKTLKNADISWWYVDDFTDLEDGHPAGTSVNIVTKNHIYEVLLSTEEIVNMYRTVVEEAVGGPVGINLVADEE